MSAGTSNTGEPLSADFFARAQLLALVNRLAEPELGLETRLDLVEQMRRVLDSATLEPVTATPAAQLW